MSQPVIDFANELVNTRLYGDMDYYIAKTTERNRAISLLIAHIKSQDAEIMQLKADQRRLDKIIDGNRT